MMVLHNMQSTPSGRYVNDIIVYLCAIFGLFCLSRRRACIVNGISAYSPSILRKIMVDKKMRIVA